MPRDFPFVLSKVWRVEGIIFIPEIYLFRVGKQEGSIRFPVMILSREDEGMLFHHGGFRIYKKGRLEYTEAYDRGRRAHDTQSKQGIHTGYGESSERRLGREGRGPSLNMPRTRTL